MWQRYPLFAASPRVVAAEQAKNELILVFWEDGMFLTLTNHCLHPAVVTQSYYGRRKRAKLEITKIPRLLIKSQIYWFKELCWLLWCKLEFLKKADKHQSEWNASVCLSHFRHISGKKSPFDNNVPVDWNKDNMRELGE
jgi:hypothetical protein